MHQLQQGIRSNWTEGSPRHLSFKHLAARASPHYGTAILCHHGPPEPLLSESQGLLLALMVLAHRDDKGQQSLCLAFWDCVYIHETLVQDETVVNTEEHLALLSLGLCSKALLEDSIPLEWWCALPARAISASWACSSLLCA